MKVLKKRIIPSGWELKKIRDIASTGSGGTPLSTNKENYEGGTIPWINSGEVYGYKINSTESFITQKGLNSSSAKLFPKGSILIAMYGATAGKSSILNFEAATNQAICSIVLNNDYNHYFLKYYLDLLYDYLVGVSTGSARDNLNQKGIQDLEIPFPDIDLQNKIAKVLSNLDNKIELNNKINKELESMSKLIYDYWFVQFDFPDENGKPYKSSGGKMIFNEELKREIPDSVLVKEISELISVKDGTHDSPKFRKTGHNLITSKHLKSAGLDFENAKYISTEDYENINKRSKVDSEDILFSMIGNVGVVYKVEEKEIDFAIKNVALFKTSDIKEYKNYIYLHLTGHYCHQYVGNVISGSIQKFIGLGSLRRMPIIIDDLMVKKFNYITEPVFKKMENLRLENLELTKLRDWLLPLLMNGQVTVN